MDRRKPRNVGMIPCLTFVRQGVAKPNMEKIRATKEELREVVKNLHLREAEFRNRPGNEHLQDLQTEPMSDADAENENNAVDDYYDLDNYDDEPVESGFSYNTEAMLLNSNPESENEDDSSDDEEEEFVIKPDDNLIVAGQVSDDVCLLQLYVLNVEKQEFFLLNDTYLPTYPVAVEWLDFNPKDSSTGHYAAVGYMEPEIHVWDLNLAECLEPAYCLGSKKQKKTLRHKAAVMDLAWNTSARHVMASGSADHTVILWDLNECKSVTRLETFAEKVQTVKWHPMETQTLLTGVCDGTVKLFDCRSPDTHKTWQYEGEIERIMWNKFDPMYFFATTEKGMVHYVDLRGTKPVWNLNAHTSSVGGIAQSSFCQDFLVTGSQDETAKVWDLKDDRPTFVMEKEMNIGHIYSMSACPDSPYVFAAGGSKPDNHLYVWDAREHPEVVERFKGRFNTIVRDGDNACDRMEEDVDAKDSSSLFQFKQTKGKESHAHETSTSSNGASSSKKSAKSLSKMKKKKNNK